MKAYGYDFHQTMIAKIEAAQRPLRVRELAHFAALYGVGVQELIYPPNGSLPEVEQEIAEIEAERAKVREQAEVASYRLHNAQYALAEAQMEYEVSARETAMLEGRLAFLLEERKALTGWDAEEEPSPAEGRTATS